MFWFIVLLLVAGAGFYFYQKMMEIEREIRAEQQTSQVANESTAAPEPVVGKEEAVSNLADTSDSGIVTPEVEQMTTKAVLVEDDSLSIEDEVLAAVKNLPGMKQTELYDSFADVSKKQLQQLLKDLDESGKLKREKQGSSYLLYPT